MPSVDEMRNQFDGLTINDKYEYVTQLKEFVETKGNPEHKDFLIECVNKYNAEAQRAKQAQTSSDNSAVNAEQQQPQRQSARTERPMREAEHSKKSAGEGFEKLAGGIGKVLRAIPKPVLFSIASVFVAGVTLLTLWATGLLPWGRNDNTPEDLPPIENIDNGDVLTSENDTITPERVTGDDADGTVDEVPASDDELYAEAFEVVRKQLSDGVFASRGGVQSVIRYAFHDIDNNGIKELIFNGDTAASIYTLSNGSVVELISLFGPEGIYTGINENGYIVGRYNIVIETFSEHFSGGSVFFSEIAPDGVSLVNYSAYRGFSYGGGRDFGENEYEIDTPNEKRVVTEAEYDNFVESMTAPMLELNWRHFTATTVIAGTDIPSWQIAYAEFLRDKKSAVDAELEAVLQRDSSYYDAMGETAIETTHMQLGRAYLLYDLDKNGIPEIFLSSGDVLAYVNGEVTNVGNIYEEYGAYWVLEIGIPSDGSDGLIVSTASSSSGLSAGTSWLKRITFTNETLGMHHFYTQGWSGDGTSSIYDSDNNPLSQDDISAFSQLFADSKRLVFKDIDEYDWQILTDTTGTGTAETGDAESAIDDYLKQFVLAVNNFDFDLLKDSIDPAGRLYEMQRELIDYYRDINMKQEFLGYDIQDITKVSDNEYTVVVTELFNMQARGETTRFQEFRNTYTVRNTPQGFKVSELLNLEILETRNLDISLGN